MVCGQMQWEVGKTGKRSESRRQNRGYERLGYKWLGYKRLGRVLITGITLYITMIVLQSHWAHREDGYIPPYSQLLIDEETDRNILFLQTGLGPQAVDKLIEQDQFDTALALQDAMFEPTGAECTPLFGWFTRVDRRAPDERIILADLRPGDILLTFSTHSLGWRHGHAGLVVGENAVLESISIGEASSVVSADHWRTYRDFVVLRVKDADEELQKAVAAYAQCNLNGVSYRLLSGWIGEKAGDIDDPWFGAHCSYLIWYAWNQFGVDLDSDGGRLVTCDDIVKSEWVEVVQAYGKTVFAYDRKLAVDRGERIPVCHMGFFFRYAEGVQPLVSLNRRMK